MAFKSYVLVGAAATATHYALLTWLVERLRVEAGWAAAAGAAVGALVAYAGNRAITFAGTAAPHARALPRFILVAALGVATSGAVVRLGTQAGLHYLAAQVLATLLVLLLGYRINRRWSFA